MLPLLFPLNLRRSQPRGLLVALAPLAILAWCAGADQTPGDVRRTVVQVQPIVENGDGGMFAFSAVCLQFADVARLKDARTAGIVHRVAWAKSQAPRRVMERWPDAPAVCLVVLPSGASPSAAPARKAFGASSPEYLVLRQLRL